MSPRNASTTTIDVALDGAPGLVHADLSAPGYGRRRHGRGFSFLAPDGGRLADPKALAHCRALVIPPAWEGVWICRQTNGHILCTGIDERKRKQYLYHPLWNEWRNRRKFANLAEFAACLHRVRDATARDLKGARVSRRRVVAAAVRLVDRGLVRVGNEAYTRDNSTFGATTLRTKHVATEPDGSITLDFNGKSNKERHVAFEDPALARSLAYCAELPGQRLFQYADDDGTVHPVTSSDVNAYLRAASGLEDVSAKDFRTWGGTVKMVTCLEAVLAEEPDLAPEKVIKKAVKDVAAGLGNTPTVCSKYYIHPQIVTLFKSGKLIDYLREHDAPPAKGDVLSGTERLVLRMLEEVA